MNSDSLRQVRLHRLHSLLGIRQELRIAAAPAEGQFMLRMERKEPIDRTLLEELRRTMEAEIRDTREMTGVINDLTLDDT